MVHPHTFIHPSTNRALHSVTMLMETDVLPLTHATTYTCNMCFTLLCDCHAGCDFLVLINFTLEIESIYIPYNGVLLLMQHLWPRLIASGIDLTIFFWPRPWPHSIWPRPRPHSSLAWLMSLVLGHQCRSVIYNRL